jgi:TPR repeat protein
MLEKNPEKRATVEEIYKIIQDDFAIPEYEYRYDKKAMNLDLNDSFALYKKMASDGISQAQYRLGRFYEKGEHVIKNKRLAFYWFNKAVNNEYLVALNKLIKKLKKLRIELYKEENDRYN